MVFLFTARAAIWEGHGCWPLPCQKCGSPSQLNLWSHRCSLPHSPHGLGADIFWSAWGCVSGARSCIFLKPHGYLPVGNPVLVSEVDTSTQSTSWARETATRFLCGSPGSTVPLFILDLLPVSLPILKPEALHDIYCVFTCWWLTLVFTPFSLVFVHMYNRWFVACSLPACQPGLSMV